MQVDASGTLRGELPSARRSQGRSLKLDARHSTCRGRPAGVAGAHGAFVAMDVHNGEILALGSSPTLDPNVFSKRIKQSDYSRLTSRHNGAPLFDRAIQGGYPTGSTFKPITVGGGARVAG